MSLSISSIQTNISCGTDLLEACRDMCNMAVEHNTTVHSSFNGEKIIAHSGSNPSQLAGDVIATQQAKSTKAKKNSDHKGFR